MIAEAGLAALWLAAGLAAFQFVLMVLALRSPIDVTRSMRGELAEAKVEARMRRLSR